MDIQLGQDRLSEERAFIQRYTDTIAARPVNYGKDYTAPAESRPRKVGIIGIPLAEPPLRDEPVAGPSSGSLELTIKSLKPALTYTLTARPTDSVLDLKKAVSSTSDSSIPVDAQRLLLKGKALADNKLLKEYDLASGAVVHLMIKAVPTSSSSASASTSGMSATSVPAPSAPESVPHSSKPSIPSIDLPKPSIPSNPSISGGSGGGGMGHHRVPSLTITTETDSPSGSSSPGKEIPLNLNMSDAPPLGPQAQVSSASFHQTIADPAFWQKVHDLCMQEFKSEVDADQAWEAFLLAVKGRLSAGEAAKIRDVVGVRGMGGA